MKNKDYSFIRLKPSLAEATNIDTSIYCTLPYYGQVRIATDDKIRQMSNVKEGIGFNDNIEVFVANLCGENLLDITNNTGIQHFTGEYGTPQIAFEIAYIGQDFYFEPVILKFVHVTTNKIYYSNPIFITNEDKDKTFALDYWNSFNFQGISYENAPFKQSIRLSGGFISTDNKNEVGGYYQQTRETSVSFRGQFKRFEKYLLERYDRLSLEALEVALFHENIYINGNKVTDKPIPKTGEPSADTNLINSEFVCAINYDNTYVNELEILDDFKIISSIPTGTYTLSGLPTDFTVIFNKNIALHTGTIKLIKLSDNSILNTITTGAVTNAEFFSDDFIKPSITTNGNYLITISQDMFSGGGQSLPYTEIYFSVSDADFDGADFNNNDFFTN
jgi:hypothetical protein